MLYKDTLDALHGPQSAVIMSSSNDDEEHLQRHHTSEAQRKKLIDRFLDPADPLALLIVCDMLITGFDAPVEQVLYLDAPLRDHTLLQAIARVNRTAEKKDFGLVVDYWGVSAQLQDALAVFTDSDVQGALEPKDSELPRLKLRHQDALRFFARVKDQDDLSACVRVLLPKDLRAEFTLAFRRFSQSLDRLLPDTRALAYVDDLRRLGKIRLAAAATYRDDTMDLSDCGAKVRKLIEDAVSAAGIQVLVQRVALFSPDFDDKLAALRTPEAQASEMEHALDDEIRVKLDQDPAFYQSLKERLLQIIADREAQRIDAARQLELLQTLRRDAAAPARGAQRLGLSQTAYAIWGLLGGAADGAADAQVPYGKDADARVALAGLLEDALAAPMALVDWHSKESVQRDMRRQIKRHLSAAGFPAPSHDGLAEAIVTLLKSRHGRGGPG